MQKKQVVKDWEYLKKTEPRGKRIYEIIKSYIKDCKVVVDMNCGYAPLYPYLKGLDYYGYDSDKDCIEYLKKKYPNGSWKCCTDDKISPPKKFDLLLVLG
jgi:hypothetical protein